jgi:nucleoside-diphosphate-sugar epimerase
VTSQHILQKSRQTVLVLGSNSFIAKNIISKIYFKKIYCVQKKKTYKHSAKNIKYYYFDLLDQRKLKIIINLRNYDKIIICASNNNNSSNLNKNNNIDIFSQNTCILLNVLENIKYNKKVEVINFSSTEIKKKKETIYSISKKVNYILCNFYKTNYNLKIKNLIIPNVFGENDLNFQRVIPFFVKNIILKKKIFIKKKKKIKFIYIDDLLKVLVDDKKKLFNTYFISVNKLKINILNLINLKKNLEKDNFKELFDFNLYKTINWYKWYFKKNESWDIGKR